MHSFGSIAFETWADKAGELKWRQHLKNMANRMAHAGGQMTASILLDDMELGKIAMSDRSVGRLVVRMDRYIPHAPATSLQTRRARSCAVVKKRDCELIC